MTKYELVIVLPGNLEKDNSDKLSQKIKKTVATAGATIVKETDWGVKHLAYPVKHETNGHYFIWDIEIATNAIRELRRLLNFETELLRYLLLKVDEK
ncbi:MAG: 30S ribosomal protein S6 [Patescibacteria group bacterium]|jgi:small subunit ribosomal protein S6